MSSTTGAREERLVQLSIKSLEKLKDVTEELESVATGQTASPPVRSSEAAPRGARSRKTALEEPAY